MSDGLGECSICLEPFGEDFDHTPKLLFCGHSFCQKDLKILAKKRQILCPNGCGYTKLNDKGVEGLNSNYALMEIVRNLFQITETKCVECQEETASTSCPDCNADFCKRCSDKIHSMRFAKNHKVTSGGKPIQRATCEEHQGYRLDLFCHKEQAPICILCRDYGKHKDHSSKVDLITAVSKTQEAKFRVCITILEKRVKELKKMAKNMENIQEQISSNALKAEKAVANEIDKLMYILESRKTKLIQKVRNEQKLKDKSLYIQCQEVATHISTLDGTLQQVQSLMGAGHLELLKHCAIITQADHKVTDSNQCEKLQIVDSKIVFSFSGEVGALLGAYGEIGCPPAPCLVLESKESDMEPTISWKIVAQNIEQFSVELCEEEEKQQSHVVWKQVKTCGGSTNTTTVPQLKCATKYQARIRARDLVAWGEYSNTINLATPNVVVPIGMAYHFKSMHPSGAHGPSQRDCDGMYRGTSLNNFVKVRGDGIQQWTVPYTAKYQMEAYGARGIIKNSTPGGSTPSGGGAVMSGEFYLKEGDILDILVGQEGMWIDGRSGHPSSGGVGGGCGGTFVVCGKTPLISAGGGGSSCSCIGKGLGGRTSRKGGLSGMCDKDSAAKEGSCGENAGSGAGINGSAIKRVPHATPAMSFFRGGTGSISNSSDCSNGGFGGGGSGYTCYGGGGGGYTGGDAGCGAGGGGSYNTGTNQTNTGGANQGQGKVFITIK